MEKIKELLNARKAFSARILGVLLLFLGLAMPNVVKADTVTVNPSLPGTTSTSLKNGQNAYNSTDNTSSYATISTSNNTNVNYGYWKFDFSSIPSDATISSVTCSVRTQKTANTGTLTIALTNNTTVNGAPTTVSSPASTITPIENTGSWTPTDLNNLQLRVSIARTEKKGPGYTSVNAYVYGANLTVTYTAPDHTVTIASGITNGTISVDKTSGKQGEKITLSNTPADGYELDYYTVNGTKIDGNTFTMPAGNVTVSAAFAPKRYAITGSTLAGGSITAKVNNTEVTSAAEGATVTLSNNPNDGYQFVANSYTVDGVAITGNTFTMPNHPVTVSGTFEPIPVENGNVVYTSQIDPDKVYTIRSTRAFLYSATSNLVTSTATSYTTPTEDATNGNQQFKFVPTATAGQYYLYSVGAGQYVTSTGGYTSSTSTGNILTLTYDDNVSGVESSEGYVWFMKIGNNVLNSQVSGQNANGIVFDTYSTHDAGNIYRIQDASYKPEPEETTVFVRKTSGAIDPNKKYLVVYEKSATEAILMKSKFTSATESPYARAILGVSGFTINNNAIETPDKNAIVFVASTTGNQYYLKNNGTTTNYYCGTTSSQQYLNVSTSQDMPHTVEFDATDGHAKIVSTNNGNELKFSPTAGSGAYTGFTGLDGFFYGASYSVYLYEEISADGYRVTCSSNTGGTVTANPYYGLAGGETVTLTVTAQTGYELVSLTAKDATGATVAIENNSFTMPEHDVTVSAVFAGRDDIYVLKGSGDIDTSKRYVLVCQDGLNPATGIMMKSNFTAYSTGDNNRGVAGEEIIITNNYLTTDAANTFSFEDAGDGKFYVKNHVGYYMGAFTTESDTQDQYFNVTQTASENYYNAVSFGPYGNVLLTSVSEMPLQYDANIRNNTDLFFYGGWNTDGTFRGLVYLYEQLSDYKITCETEEGGLVAANPAFAPVGTEISLSTFPEAGHSFLSLAVKDINGNPITVTGNKFRMPSCDVIITSEWTRLPLTVSKYGWSTFYLNHPFVMPEGVTGVVISSYGQPEDIDFSLNLNYMYPAGSVVPTKTPILVKGNQGSYTYSLSEVEGTAPDTNWLRGQMRYGMIVPEESAVDTHYYYKLTTGTSEGNKGVLGFFWGADGGDEFYLKGDNRAYLVVPRTASASAMRFNFDEEVPDGILDLKPETSNMEHGTIYNLAGQRISQPVRGQIYIMNGQKFIAK